MRRAFLLTHFIGKKLKHKTLIINTASIACISFFITACGGGNGGSSTKEVKHFLDAVKLGGDTTDMDFSNSGHAFSTPSKNLSANDLDKHLSGDVAFEQAFITAPNVSFPNNDGAGPVFNDNNCNACHQRDGRANLPLLSTLQKDDSSGYYKLGNAGLFLRISIESEAINCAPKSEANCWGAPVAVPNFSDQLFHRSVAGFIRNGAGIGQADVWMKYQTHNITYPDGKTVQLSKPIFVIDNPYDAPDNPNTYNAQGHGSSRLFQSDVRIGPRIGLPVFGLGLIGAIKDDDILALADPTDSDGDGISGKPNWVCDKEKYDKCKKKGNCESNPPISLGKYGWKANTPTVAHQGLGALQGDMGVTNPLFPKESIAGTDLMAQYKEANPAYAAYKETKEGKIEANMKFSQDVVFYTETLHVPGRRNIDNPSVRKGGELFESIGCVKCHTPSYVTGKETSFSTGGKHIKSVENQVIYPFSDMLLHDMGPGLADGRKDFDANGNEWKTRQLWGIGLTKRVNPGAGFLHDGRARTLEEAILWHGGESEGIKNNFMQLNEENRQDVINFLNSL